MRRVAIALITATALLAPAGARAARLDFEGTLRATIGSLPPIAISGR